MRAPTGQDFQNKFDGVPIKKSQAIERRGTYSDHNSTQRTDFQTTSKSIDDDEHIHMTPEEK